MSRVPLSMNRFIFILASLTTFAAADAGKRFLGVRERHFGALDSRGPADLLAELERLDDVAEFDHQKVVESRVDRLETALLPLFKISPQDASGFVDAKAARYILHRLFSQRHGWIVNGVSLQTGYQNASKVGHVLRLGEHFSLRQLARFAATLETLIHAENLERLQSAFDMCDFSRQQNVSQSDASKVIEAYMMKFVSISVPAGASYEAAKEIVRSNIPSWPETRKFFKEIQKDVASKDASAAHPGSLWDFCVRIIEQISERYGQWQNKDCIDLKSQLMQWETPGTGRVPLRSFWAPIQNEDERGEKWLFSESLPYLEQLGALEGSEAPNHSVVIPNYLLSAANCLASSKYYDVCCLNECDAILSQLESRIEAPEAVPHRLVQLLSTIPSSSVKAPRELSATLKQHLEEVALHHGGKVPLHGRLFFQIMSHAYPRECPYPLASLSTPIEKSDAYFDRSTDGSRVSREVVREYCAQAGDGCAGSVSSGADIPWTNEEDLFMKSMWADGSNGSAEPSMLVPLCGSLLMLLAFMLRLRKPLTKLVGLYRKALL